MKDTNPIPMVVAVRGFVQPVGHKPSASYPMELRPGNWSFVFDCETTTDERQALKFGFYQLRQGARLVQSGCFYVASELNKGELATLKKFVNDRQLELLTHQEFLDQIFLDLAYELGAVYIGLNLPFDISRLAIGHSEAKASVRQLRKGQEVRPPTGRSMVGGFSFKFCEDPRKPRLQVKHLSSRNALMRFTIRRDRQDTPGGMRRRDVHPADIRGHFVDIRSLASALLSGSWGLASLAEFLGTEHRKIETEEHGKITAEYLEYGLQDVQVTWECYCKLAERYQQLGLKTSVEKIISEASLGKADLAEMGVKPWLPAQPSFPRRLLGAAMASYYGGRSEVHARRIAVPIMYCDFLSMYPTVCVLMKLWSFVIASEIRVKMATDWTRDFLESVTLEDLQDPTLWQKLTVLVRVKPDGDIFPVRAKYDTFSRSIGLNMLSAKNPMWFTLADCIASKLLTGKAPTVVEAVAFRPGEAQEGLLPLAIAGNPEYLVDPTTEDFYKRVIELRTSIKARMKEASPDDRERLQTEQQALKILANATSYGIFVELNPNKHGRPVAQECFGTDDEPFEVSNETVEEPGKYFNPILGTLITGAARLMLALTEKLASERNLTWAFCDTDGIALTPETRMTQAELERSVEAVRDWFKNLSPYDGIADILKVEDENYGLADGNLRTETEPLFCYAISSKRYALFNKTEGGEIVLRKATAHGLGHLMAPYEDDNGPATLPTPVKGVCKDGLRRWHADLWVCIIRSGLSGTPQQLDLRPMPGLDNFAVSRYTATTPELLDWFKNYNEGREYRQQVRPFGFMMSYQPKQELGVPSVPRASAPFHRDPAKGALHCFDRETGEIISPDQLKTVREALARFHLHTESKFLRGSYTDTGFTARRHVTVTGVEHIGKEANRWEDSFAAGEVLTEELNYGESPEAEGERLALAIEQCRKCNRRKLAEVSKVSLREVTRILTGKVEPTKEILVKLETASASMLT